MNLTEEEIQCKIECYGYFSYPLDDRYRASPEALGPANTIAETRAKIRSNTLNIFIKGKIMGNYLLKAQLQMQSTGASFCIFLV